MVIGCRGAGGDVEFEMTGEEVGDVFGASGFFVRRDDGGFAGALGL